MMGWFKRAAAAAAAIGICGSMANAAPPDPVEGDWAAGGGVVLRISPCSTTLDRLCGLIIAWPDTKDGRPPRDAHNPDPRFASRPLVGLPMIYGFRRASNGHWTGGKIYNPDDGKTYDSNLEAAAGGTLHVQGCVLILCKTQTWKRPG
jgi:uncharacterized protein (DUF2147 family)